MAGLGDGDFITPNSSETVVRGQLGRETRRAAIARRDEVPPWSIGDRMGDFVLEEFLDRGSSGFVYRVQEIRTGQHYALKLLRPGSAEDLVRNKCGFRRMRTVSHPGLVRVHRIYRLEQFIGLTMEEVHGQTLNHYVSELQQLPIERRWTALLKLTRQYASALAHMHSRGLLHRDIKPPNLMVDDQGNGRIVDYGLVGTFDPQEDPNGFRHYIVGSPDYMPPEACWDRFYVPAGDVFGLGISMLQVTRALQGEETLPRSEESRREDGRMIKGAIDSLNANVPELIRETCREMLSSHPSERPSALEISRLGLPVKTARAVDFGGDFFGRETELNQLRSWVRLIASGGTGRLHLLGESGVGKTKLIDRLLDEFPKNGWIQIFRARCLPREDQPLQAFDQLVDEIVTRFMKSDREPIEMDVVSTGVLHEAFPQLECMITANKELHPPENVSDRLDALESGVRLGRALASLGPVILIIDDVHWADRDSLNTLDALQSAVGECFGIITISRGGDHLQRVPADAKLKLSRLSDEDAADWLRYVANRWNVDVSDQQLQQWAKICEGCPLDLHLLADALKPGGMISQRRAGSDNLHSFSRQKMLRWRIDQISAEARKTLEMICLAGRDASYAQLAELTGIGESIEVQISELAHQRLIVDEATNSSDGNHTEERVHVAHARIQDVVLAITPQHRQIQGHFAWAKTLMGQPESKQTPGRIAGHLLDAQAGEEAVPYAIAAAEEAEKRVAMTEAARWREKTLPQLSGDARLHQLRETARCFDEADRPSEAAKYYLRCAAEITDDDEKNELELKAVTHLIRCGHIAEMRSHLNRLCKRLKVPSPKPLWLTKISLIARLMRLRLQGDPLTHVPQPPIQSSEDTPTQRRNRQSLRLCLNLSRPLSVFDNLYAAELNLAGALATRRHGTEAEILHGAIGAAVFGSYLPGRKREKSFRLLNDLKPRFQAIDRPHLWGDYNAGFAFHYLLQCDWAESLEPTMRAIKHYSEENEPRSFEIMHTRWVELWSAFKVGQIRRMRAAADEMHSGSVVRNDRFGWLVTTGGLGTAAWLADDDVSSVEAFMRETMRSKQELGPQWLDIFNWLSECMVNQYRGLWSRVLSSTQKAYESWLHPMCRRHQLIDVLRLESLIRSALSYLEQMRQEHPSPTSRVIRSHAVTPNEVQKWIRQLEQHDLPYSKLKTAHFEGRLALLAGNHPKAERSFHHAAELAESLKIVPCQLSSQDWLEKISTGMLGNSLSSHLRSEDVVAPESFRRLYD